MRSLCRLLACGVPLLCPAGEIPEPVLPAGVGVNIHFVTGHERDLDLIQAAGFKFIRMDFGWASIERTKGQYHWSDYEELLANLETRGLRPVFILDYSNPLYEETGTSTNPITHVLHRTLASPQHPESVEGYARWAAAAARHFQGRHVIWELWNEPNISFWSPKPDVQQYTTMALAACKAVREAEPQATIVGPASSGFPWDFLETFLKSGVLEYLDAVSVHPYRSPKRAPETAAEDYHRLRQLIDRYAPPERKGPIPILSGEWGYSTFSKGVALETQAAFAARQQLANLLEGVPLSIWYDWKNDGSDPNENEHNFGTVGPDLKPKPSYVAIQTLTRALAGYRIEQRLPLPDEKDYVLICRDSSGKTKLAAWAIGDPHSLRLRLAGNPAANPTALKSDGEAFTVKVVSGQLMLELTAGPQYVALDRTTVAGP